VIYSYNKAKLLHLVGFIIRICQSDLDTNFCAPTLVSLHCPNTGTWWTVDLYISDSEFDPNSGLCADFFILGE
jgi:hypothetical protein